MTPLGPDWYHPYENRNWGRLEPAAGGRQRSIYQRMTRPWSLVDDSPFLDQFGLNFVSTPDSPPWPESDFGGHAS